MLLELQSVASSLVGTDRDLLQTTIVMHNYYTAR